MVAQLPVIPPIPPREREEILKVAREYRLDLHDPQLMLQMQLIDYEHPSYLHLLAWKYVRERIAMYLKVHDDLPFPVAPASMLPGKYVLAYQKANGAPVMVSQELLARHSLFTSASGGGKTTLAHHLVLQLLSDNVKVLTVDPKDDSRFLATMNENCLVLHPGALFNLLQPPGYLTKEEYISTLISCFTKAFFSAELAKQVLNEAMQKVLTENSMPTFAALHEAVKKAYNRNETYSRRDANTGTALRLQRLLYNYPGMYSTARSISFETLFQHSVYIPVVIMDEATEFVISYLVHQLYLHNRAKNIRNGLSTLIYLDEGLTSYSKQGATQTHISGNPLSYLQSLIREFALGMCVTTTCISQTDEILRSSAGIQVCMGLTSGAEVEEISRSFNLSKAGREYLNRKICLGECIIKMNADWKDPILAVFPKMLLSKVVSLADWEDAKRRIDRLIPPAPPGLPGSVSVAPSEEPAQKRAPRRARLGIQLSESEEALLRVVCERLMPITEAFKVAELAAQVGTNAKKRLLLHMLVHEEAVVTGSGRGKRAMVLFPEERAYTLLRMKVPHGTRGGDGGQHRYLVEELARLVEGEVEQFLGGKKSIDVAVAYQEKKHQKFLQAVQELSGIDLKPQDLEEHELIALEIETSSAAGGVSNSKKDIAVGVALVIEAVLPTLQEKVSKDLDGVEDVVVVDVLKLLDLLREARD